MCGDGRFSDCVRGVGVARIGPLGSSVTAPRPTALIAFRQLSNSAAAVALIRMPTPTVVPGETAVGNAG